MAFKTVKDYNEERYGGMFLLRNDRDSADVVFLYRSIDDVLVADVHYLKSSDYSGYVHCCGKGCPACERGIRVQNKLFIPLYNIQDDEIQFFDRSTRFESILQSEVFSKYPNPSEFVFRITRHGEPGSLDTKYEITAVAKNTEMSYDSILAKFNAKFPDYYEKICKDLLPVDMESMLNSKIDYDSSDNDSLPSYQVTPRGVSDNTPKQDEPLQVPEDFEDVQNDADVEDLGDEEVKF